MIINLAGGTGIMGETHKPIFERAGHGVIISGRKTTPGLEEATKISDLSIACVPISATRGLIQRIAPYCTAIMDFTGVKQDPMRAMLDYSPQDCEIGGMHPLYREFSPGRTVVYCPTSRSGPKCAEVIKSLEVSGAKIKVMPPDKHDKAMALLQNARIKIQEAYGLLLQGSGLGINELYELAPPNTRPILDLLARQITPANDELFREMCEYNPFTAGSIGELIELILKTAHTSGSSEQLRRFFNNQLHPAQERAKALLR